MTLRDVAIGALFAGFVAILAWRGRALTRGGAVAAFIVGTLTYASGTIGFTLVLLAFFVPSVLLSRLGRARKCTLVDIGKGGARDAMQVAANGGIATACAVAFAFTHDARWAFAFCGAYAAATGDTWGTEIGTLARRGPRSILTLRPVPAGLSGGITLPGTLAEIAGACWIGLLVPAAIALAYVGWSGEFGWATVNGPWFVLVRPFAAVPLGGIAGATVDSVLGATLQALRRCDVCGRTCETDRHVCGNPTRLVRGLGWFTNDLVNLSATLVGAAVAFAIVLGTAR